MSNGVPARPREERPELLGFERQKMVRWLSPREILRTGFDLVLSGVFAAYSDKREIQAALVEAEVYDFSHASEPTIDYVADLGDGFDSTFSVASFLAAGHLDVDAVGGGTVTLPRGVLLVMGGDQVYPSATMENYRDRTTGPYRAALPHTEDDHPTIFAIPGNHDWYDGLTAFIRLFCQGNWIGGWRTLQRRSYFAIKLPGDWWLWGIDIQFDTYIDEPQLRYFTEQVAPRVQPGDSVILCSAKPTWVKSNELNPEAFQALDHFERKIVRETCGATLRLSITGDSHHYAHYYDATGDTHRITAGGGGAFLSSTHHLRDEIVLPPPNSKDPGKTVPAATYGLQTCYPDKTTSRRLRWGVFRLPLMTPSFALVIAVIYGMYGWVLQEPWRTSRDAPLAEPAFVHLTDVFIRLGRSPTALAISVVLGLGLVGLTKGKPPWRKWVFGLVHLYAHLGAVCVIAWYTMGALQLRGAGFLAAYAAILFFGGGMAGSMVVALYLNIADLFGLNGNELFAAQRFERHKNFLRMRFADDGTLVVYPIVIDRISRRWRLRESDEPDDGRSWFVSDRPGSRPRLASEPLYIRPGSNA